MWARCRMWGRGCQQTFSDQNVVSALVLTISSSGLVSSNSNCARYFASIVKTENMILDTLPKFYGVLNRSQFELNGHDCGGDRGTDRRTWQSAFLSSLMHQEDATKKGLGNLRFGRGQTLTPTQSVWMYGPIYTFQTLDPTYIPGRWSECAKHNGRSSKVRDARKSICDLISDKSQKRASFIGGSNRNFYLRLQTCPFVERDEPRWEFHQYFTSFQQSHFNSMKKEVFWRQIVLSVSNLGKET